MSRTIDNLPSPSQIRPMKIIGVGASRTGTLGLYTALKILGYHPFHISEFLPYGVQQMRALQEAISAIQGKGSSKNKPFGRAEFDRLWGDYDCLIESPCYLGVSGIQVYLQDPDVKFILTDRSPRSFAKSIAGSLGNYNAKLQHFPLSIAKYFDGFLWELSGLFKLMTFRWSKGLIDPTDPAFVANLEESYIQYVSDTKKIVPSDRLLILNLEKGFGWDEICDFLDCKVPEAPYPRINSMSDFHVAAEMVVSPARKKATRIIISSTVVILSIGAWWWRR